MKKLKNFKGITLIALVVTIIVLLIIAGIAILTLTGDNGIIKRSSAARESNEKAAIKENLDLANQSIYLDYIANQKNKKLTSYYTDYSDYTSPNTFISSSKFNNTEYPIQSYEVYKAENINCVDISVRSRNNNGTIYRYIIKLDEDELVTNTYTEGDVDDIVEVLEEIQVGNMTEIKVKNTSYIINYELNDGVNPANAPTTGKKGRATVYPTPTKEGYLFAGWYDNAEFTGSRKIQTDLNVTADEITVYAKWAQKVSGDMFNWTFDTTTQKATITGFSENGITQYNNGNITELIIPDTYSGTVEDYQAYIGYAVDKIGDSAFKDCDKITGTIMIPDTVTEIGTSAFSRCNKATTVIIGRRVITMGNSAFSSCSKITEVVAPNTVDLAGSKDGSHKFTNDSLINKVTLTSGLDAQGNLNLNVYNYPWGDVRYTPWGESTQDNLVIEIEEGVKKLGDYTFYGVSKAKTVILPNSLEEIGGHAFEESGLTATNITFPSSLTKIGDWAFESCNSLSGTLHISGNINYVGNAAFQNCDYITKLIVDANLQTIGGSAFSSLHRLTEIEIPIDKNWTGVSGSYIFTNSTAINKITITPGANGNGVDYLDWYAAWQLPWGKSHSSLERQVIIERGVRYIGQNTFYDTNNKVTFKYNGTQQQWNDEVTINSNGNDYLRNIEFD